MRLLYKKTLGRNVVHGSDSPENGKREIGKHAFLASLVQNSSFLLSSYTALPLNLSSSHERGKVNFVLVSKFHTSWLKCI